MTDGAHFEVRSDVCDWGSGVVELIANDNVVWQKEDNFIFGTISDDCLTITWNGGSQWVRHLDSGTSQYTKANIV